MICWQRPSPCPEYTSSTPSSGIGAGAPMGSGGSGKWAGLSIFCGRGACVVIGPPCGRGRVRWRIVPGELLVGDRLVPSLVMEGDVQRPPQSLTLSGLG